jgi:hypothetical protein
MVLAQNRHKDQWNRIQYLEIKPHNYSHLIFDKEERYTWRKLTLFTNGAGKNVYVHEAD